MAITNLSKLHNTNPQKSIKMCDCCLGTFYRQDRYNAHLPCIAQDYIQREVMPKDPVLKFKDFNKCVDLADIVYADTEAILEPTEGRGKLQKHVPCCVGSYWVSAVDGTEYKEFRDENCMVEFCDYLEDLAKHFFRKK